MGVLGFSGGLYTYTSIYLSIYLSICYMLLNVDCDQTLRPKTS